MAPFVVTTKRNVGCLLLAAVVAFALLGCEPGAGPQQAKTQGAVTAPPLAAPAASASVPGPSGPSGSSPAVTGATSTEAAYKKPELLEFDRETAERHIKLKSSAAALDLVDVDAAYDLAQSCLIEMGLTTFATLPETVAPADLFVQVKQDGTDAASGAPYFTCDGANNSGKCAGLFEVWSCAPIKDHVFYVTVTPTANTLRHEFIHYHLQLGTGDDDHSHKTKYWSCQ